MKTILPLMISKFALNTFRMGLLLITVSGCTTMTSHPADPFEKVNRGIFSFNKDVDSAVLKPLAETYKTLVPKPIDQGVTNFFGNIGDITVAANDLFQLKFKYATSDISRFLINTTVGLLGVFDIASQVGFKKREEDFGQTLGYWGIKGGAYLILPFLGPSSVRDSIGWGVDFLFDPRYYAKNRDVNRLFLMTNSIKAVDIRADLLGTEKVLGAAALDEYAYIRDAYLQRREFLVHDGEVSGEKQKELDDLFDDS